MVDKLIYGIQQIGVGVDDAAKVFEWYATRLGSDIAVFEDNNIATEMSPYMGGKPHKKKAILAMNMRGGSGYEIWQYLDRTPKKPKEEINVGDFGINVAFIKTREIQKTFDRLFQNGENIISEIVEEPDGMKSFYMKDPCNNLLKVKEHNSWYSKNGLEVGGTFGCLIGVSDINSSLKLYSDILEYDQVIYDQTGIFPDLEHLPNGKGTFRRVLLGHKPNRKGGFSKLLGESQIELIESLNNKPRKIFEDRYWGDIGFIHLCFDIKNMSALTKECSEKGFPFKILSSESFDMGEANGHWGYIEDPDGTLIEFVETRKVPLIKKLKLNIDLTNRNPHKPLPNWMIKALRLNRVKFKNKGVN
ncbi:MAG: VOC family protein [Cyclobacteriaceae bacterium]|nr:VOC family protein [Cyclobacteriaceae bacterium]